jgi:hypothetical protein
MWIVAASLVLSWIGIAAQEQSSPSENPASRKAENATANRPQASGATRMKPTEFTMLPLGAKSGEDDDPTIVRARDGSFHLAWLSKRTGNAEIFAARSADGLIWGEPAQVTKHDHQDWYPSLLEGPDGTFHLVWMRVTPPPDNFQHIWYNRSSDGLNWDASAEVQVTTGAVNDFAPNLSQDAEGNLLVYFSSTVRSKNRTSDLFVVRSLDKGASWEAPRSLSALSSRTDMEVFPWVERCNDGRFMMVFSRFDVSARSNYFHPSTDLFFARSTDGLAWDRPTAITSDAAVDTLPSFYLDHSGAEWTLIWVSTARSNPPKSNVVEIDVSNLEQYPDGVANWTDRIGAAGWSPRVVATGAAELYLMVSVSRATGTPKLYSQVYER